MSKIDKLQDIEYEIREFLNKKDYTNAALVMYKVQADYPNFADNMLRGLSSVFQSFYKSYLEEDSIEELWSEAQEDLMRASGSSALPKRHAKV